MNDIFRHQQVSRQGKTTQAKFALMRVAYWRSHVGLQRPTCNTGYKILHRDSLTYAPHVTKVTLCQRLHFKAVMPVIAPINLALTSALPTA